MIALLRALWDRLSLYLPVILMGLLALGTYWLVRSTPLLTPPEQVAATRHEPDYYLHRFSVRTFDGAGRLKSEVLGAQARHYPDTDTLEISQARIRSIDAEGRLTTATANLALTNGDGSEVQLFGNAQVVREPAVTPGGQPLPRVEFRSEFLHAFIDAERVKSHKPVEIVRGHDIFTADAMEFDNLDRVMQLNGRVKGVLVPDTAK